jgi:hypothetical protein
MVEKVRWVDARRDEVGDGGGEGAKCTFDFERARTLATPKTATVDT